MNTLDNLNTTSVAALAFDEATNCAIAFGRCVYFLSCLAYAAGREFRSYCDNELIAQIELAIGIVQWLIHWLEPADSTKTSIYALAPLPISDTADVAPESEPLAVEPEPVAALAEPTVAAEPEVVALEPAAVTTTSSRRTTTSKSKAQSKSTTSSRKTKHNIA